MADASDLLCRYMDEVQPLFGEAEVIDRRIPLGALERIAQFFNMLSLCICEKGHAANDWVTAANEYLSMAEYHCHDVLTSAYREQSGAIMAQYGYQALQNASNATFYPKIQKLHRNMTEAIAAAQESRRLEEERVRKAFGALSLAGESEGKISFIEARIAESPEVRDAVRKSYEAAKALYDALTNNSQKINYSKDHGNDKRPIDRILEAVGKACTVIGLLGLLVYAVRPAIGI